MTTAIWKNEMRFIIHVELESYHPQTSVIVKM